MRVAALVLAAGRGERVGATLPKALLALAGRPLLVHAIEGLVACAELEAIIPVVPAAQLGECAALLRGRERQDSTRVGLAALPPGVELVAVHDAARPLVRAREVAAVVAAARRHGAALLAVPLRDTLKRVVDDRIAETLPRASCWAAQTPQVFRVEWLREALAKADADGFGATDDAQLVERLGIPVHVVPGDPGNLKITWPEDLEIAELLLARRSGLQ